MKPMLREKNLIPQEMYFFSQLQMVTLLLLTIGLSVSNSKISKIGSA